MNELNLDQIYNPKIYWIEKNNINTEHKLKHLGFEIKKINNANTDNLSPQSNSISRLDIQNYIEEKLNYDIYLFNEIDSALKYLLQLKFVETIIIVNNDLYNKFIKEFKKKLVEITIIPKIFIYSPENKASSILINNKIKKFYSYGVITSVHQLKAVLNSLGKKKAINLKNSSPITSVDDKLIFDQITDKKDLAFQAFYKVFIFNEKKSSNCESLCCCCRRTGDTKRPGASAKNQKMGDKDCQFAPIDNEEFIQKMSEEFGNDKTYNELLNQINDISDIPIELLSKYYIRLYTLDGNFYRKMKIDLLDDKNNQSDMVYIPYIKTLYEGLEKGALTSCDDKTLYSAQKLSEKQIEDLEKYKKSKKEGYPISTVFSKSFLSFSKEETIAKRFLVNGKNAILSIRYEKNEKNEKTKKILFSQADIEELSVFKEKEVLFFPFSAFGVDEFYKDNDEIYKLKLIYLGKFIEEFLDKKNFSLPQTKFKNEFMKSGLGNQKKINSEIKMNEVIQKYEQYQTKNSKCNKKCFLWLLVLILVLVVPLVAYFVKKKSEDCSGGYYYSTSESKCLPCNEGYYSEKGSKYCTRCNYGESSNSGSATCFLCPAGSYSDYFTVTCTNCSKG